MTTRNLALVISIVAMACGGDDGGGGGGDLSIDELGDTIGSSTCEKIFECCNAAEVMSMFEGIDPPITNVAECTRFYNALLTGLLLGPIEDAIERGTIIYHGDLAADCLAAFEAQTCDEIQSVGDPPVEGCENIFEGTLADDAECVTDAECASGFCDGDSINGDPGVCRTQPGDGEACETFDCADGFYCENDIGGEGTCMPAKADGADCNFDEDCQSDNCDDSNLCAPAAPDCAGN